MGNDLNVVYKGKVIASLGRKHNYTLDGESNLPTKEEIKYGIKSTREHIISTLCVYAGVLAGKSDDIESIVSQIEEDIVDIVDYFEEKCIISGRNEVIREITDPFNEGVEVLDDFEREKNEKEDEYLDRQNRN